MRFFYSLILSLFVMISSTSARADWHFCYAMSTGDREIYMSNIFQSDLGLNAIDSIFSSWLGDNKIEFSSANCPRADTEMAIKINLEAAHKYNTSEHKTIIDVPFPPARKK
jgi:hypothetical protein